MSTNDHELLHHAANNLLPFWQLKLAKFRGYHLRLNILHRLTPRGEYMFVLILADDLDLLVTSIRRKHSSSMIDVNSTDGSTTGILKFD